MRLPFRPEWRASVLSGEKTTTVRTSRYGAPGDEFDVDGVRFKLVAVEPMPLDAARDACWRSEGFASPDAFEAEWARGHPTRGFRPADSVWVHTFRQA